jgi:hypothetical protein
VSVTHASWLDAVVSRATQNVSGGGGPFAALVVRGDAADRHDAARGGFDDLAFYDLFDTPRDKWSMPVGRRSTPSATAPFDAWLAKTDRVDY